MSTPDRTQERINSACSSSAAMSSTSTSKLRVQRPLYATRRIQLAPAFADSYDKAMTKQTGDVSRVKGCGLLFVHATHVAPTNVKLEYMHMQ